MKKMLLGMVLLASATLFAQSPFDGTWMTKLDTAKLPSKQTSIRCATICMSA